MGGGVVEATSAVTTHPTGMFSSLHFVQIVVHLNKIDLCSS